MVTAVLCKRLYSEDEYKKMLTIWIITTKPKYVAGILSQLHVSSKQILCEIIIFIKLHNNDINTDS